MQATADAPTASRAPSDAVALPPLLPTIITGVSPSAAERGDRVTVSGIGFLSPSATVGGVPAEIVSSSLFELVLIVPEVHAGPAPIAVQTSLTGPTERPFTVIEGALLEGPPDALAVDVLTYVEPLGVLADEITAEGVFLTRLQASILTSATVGEVNEALASEGATISSMDPGFPVVTLAVPRQPDAAAIEAMARRLTDTAAFSSVIIARQPLKHEMPPSRPGDPASADLHVDHLLRSRFPQAWNAAPEDFLSCERVEVIIPDFFGPTPPTGFLDVPGGDIGQFPAGSFTYVNPRGSRAPVDTHGWEVAESLGASFDPRLPTGAQPFTRCTHVTAIEVANVPFRDIVSNIVQRIRASTRSIVSTSIGYQEELATASTVAREMGPLELAQRAAWWEHQTRALTDRFVHLTSAGNAADDAIERVYAGVSAVYDSEWNFVATGGSLLFPGNSVLWEPRVAGWPSLTRDEAAIASLRLELANLGVPETLPPRPNTLIVGASTADGSAFAPFSHTEFHVTAVGMGIPVLDGTADGGRVDGTSFSTPVVAGLAAWLWLVSDELRTATTETTTRLITQTSDATGLVDAYAATLAVDDPTAGLGGAAARRAIADFDVNGIFDEADIQAHKDAIEGVADPEDIAGLRSDLNADGVVNRTGQRELDVDHRSSSRFERGISNQTLDVSVDGSIRRVEEDQASDLDVLCAWAFSGLYAGSEAIRGGLLDGYCASVELSISPETAVVPLGETLQMSDSLVGVYDRSVRWTTTFGSITQDGLFRAPSQSGTAMITAQSVAWPAASDTATIQVGGEATITIDDIVIGECRGGPSGVCGEEGFTQHGLTWTFTTSAELTLTASASEDGMTIEATAVAAADLHIAGTVQNENDPGGIVGSGGDVSASRSGAAYFTVAGAAVQLCMDVSLTAVTDNTTGSGASSGGGVAILDSGGTVVAGSQVVQQGTGTTTRQPCVSLNPGSYIFNIGFGAGGHLDLVTHEPGESVSRHGSGSFDGNVTALV